MTKRPTTLREMAPSQLSSRYLTRYSFLSTLFYMILLWIKFEISCSKTAPDLPRQDHTGYAATNTGSVDQRFHSQRNHGIEASVVLSASGPAIATKAVGTHSDTAATHTSHLEPGRSRTRSKGWSGLARNHPSPPPRLRHRHGHALPRSRSRRQKSRPKSTNNSPKYSSSQLTTSQGRPDNGNTDVPAGEVDMRSKPMIGGNTDSLSSATKRIPINIVVLLPEEDTRLFSIKRVSPAIALATENVTSSRILTQHELVISYADSKCHIAEAMNEAIKSTVRGEFLPLLFISLYHLSR